ncbi:MAG TPA: hypothetical protein VLA17_11455 [Candidatus Limnocylindria bacterium]|nr:hypothetical protein [Candidatus Limnocylindria bacterium]
MPRSIKAKGLLSATLLAMVVFIQSTALAAMATSVERMKERGVPIEWTALGPVPAIMVGIGASAQAPHPNAAQLFVEFALSREGQKLMRTPGRHVARRALANDHTARLKELKIVPVNPALAEKLDEYARQLRSIFGS